MCAEARDEDAMILCDHCDSTFHLACLDPPLTGEWGLGVGGWGLGAVCAVCYVLCAVC